MGKTKSKSLADEVGKRQPFASLRQEAYLNLVRTHTLLAGQLSRLFKQHGLTDPKYNALRILRGEGKPMQVYQIAERMVTPQTDVTRLVDRLNHEGLATRARSDEDRRVVVIEITANGSELLAELDEPVRRLHRGQFANLNPAELEKLRKLLRKARGA